MGDILKTLGLYLVVLVMFLCAGAAVAYFLRWVRRQNNWIPVKATVSGVEHNPGGSTTSYVVEYTYVTKEGQRHEGSATLTREPAVDDTLDVLYSPEDSRQSTWSSPRSHLWILGALGGLFVLMFVALGVLALLDILSVV